MSLLFFNVVVGPLSTQCMKVLCPRRSNNMVVSTRFTRRRATRSASAGRPGYRFAALGNDRHRASEVRRGSTAGPPRVAGVEDIALVHALPSPIRPPPEAVRDGARQTPPRADPPSTPPTNVSVDSDATLPLAIHPRAHSPFGGSVASNPGAHPDWAFENQEALDDYVGRYTYRERLDVVVREGALAVLREEENFVVLAREQWREGLGALSSFTSMMSGIVRGMERAVDAGMPRAQDYLDETLGMVARYEELHRDTRTPLLDELYGIVLDASVEQFWRNQDTRPDDDGFVLPDFLAEVMNDGTQYRDVPRE